MGKHLRQDGECKDTPRSIFDVKCDAIVSPGNSFGFMEGGLNLEISEFFGGQVLERLQKLIQTRHHGELLVGLAEVVDTDHAKIPYLIAAPIMRVPTVLRETVNVYLATRAILTLVKFGTVPDGTPVKHIIETIAIPGMGTGKGKVPPHICANQMKVALENILLSQYEFPYLCCTLKKITTCYMRARSKIYSWKNERIKF